METDIRYGQNRDDDGWWWKFTINDKPHASGVSANRTEALNAAREARREWEERDMGLAPTPTNRRP